MSGGGGGGKYATMAAATGGFGRYTSVVDRYTPGMVRYGSRSDWSTPSDQEMANSCRSFLLSRLKAAEVLGRQRGSGGRAPSQPMPPSGDRNNVNLAFEQIRAKLLDLIEADITVIRQLLNVGEQLEEIKWQRNYAGGGGGGGGSTSVDMSLADIESVDLDPYMTYLASSNKRLEDDVINGDGSDDVFRSDDTGGCSTKTTCSVQSNELRLTLTRSGNGFKVNGSDGASKPRQMPGNSKSPNKLTKVEFQVSGSQEPENKSISKGQNDFNIAKESYETAEIQVKSRGTKEREEEVEKTKSNPSLQFRLMVQPTNEDSVDRSGQRSKHHPQNINAQLPSDANRRLNGSNANRTTEEATKTQSPFSSSPSHHLPRGNQSEVHRQMKTEESKRRTLDTSTVSIVTHL